MGGVVVSRIQSLSAGSEVAFDDLRQEARRPGETRSIRGLYHGERCRFPFLICSGAGVGQGIDVEGEHDRGVEAAEIEDRDIAEKPLCGV